MRLSEDIHKKVEILCAEGKAFAHSGKYHEANKKFIAALELFPQPLEQCEACSWLLTAIADMNFLQGSYEYAKQALLDAMKCCNVSCHPFIHLRLGQSLYELGDFDLAANELARAYMKSGKEIFSKEDPRYFLFLKLALKRFAIGAC